MTGMLFIRHAETDMAGTFCGHSDPPINTAGQQQVAQMISTLTSESFDEIYSSDLRRAVDTASLLSQAFAAPITTTSTLREIHFGDWEGLRWDEIERRDPHYAQRWMESFPDLPAPNGESIATFKDRVLRQVNRLLPLAEAKCIAIVTHGGVMREVLRSTLGRNDQQAWEATKHYCSSFECSGITASRRSLQ
jgi:alpha-ribazole phosphatase